MASFSAKRAVVSAAKKCSLTELLLNYGFYLAILGIIASFAIQDENFLTPGNLFNVVTQAGYLIVVSIGVIFLIILVQVVQSIFSRISRRIDRRLDAGSTPLFGLLSLLSTHGK